jgi:glycosyltransferase involved in cell wall biosynthesis
MLFSVLIPIRNRLEYLKYAVSSVLRQADQNVEIIISDNASQEDIEGYVLSLNEARIKYSKSKELLSVTENWNRSLEQSQGDYVIMLGDDDILLNNYFKIVSRLIENYEQPDLIYTNAFFFAYPNVLPGFPNGAFNSFGSLKNMPKKEIFKSVKRRLVRADLKQKERNIVRPMAETPPNKFLNALEIFEQIDPVDITNSCYSGKQN